MSFWWLIKPSVHTIIRVSRSKAAAKKNEEIVHARTSVRQQLQPIDEFFLFLIYLSVCGFEGERPGTPFPCTPLHSEQDHFNMDKLPLLPAGISMCVAVTS
ncbi:hypothetical protein DNTS_031951 [Danionella cerebrum]|uniref:Uncharacterized protein n=1 Tax=Danionella cerebrum TaxID=2873325 RepID=A0A553PED7_9TELE|nr:hypothetical protein DNTS_031951 [Danionella translucida]